MGLQMKNIEMAQVLIERLVSIGVSRFCFCAGARNAPLIEVLDHSRGIFQKSFFDERSAGFFALGMAKQSGEAAAVITTSGTAVAELLPAVIEAYYSGQPLVLITADRPRAYRGSAAPQAIEQVGIFSAYTKIVYDIEAPFDFATLNIAQAGVTHINICFSEPLIDGSVETLDFSYGRQKLNQAKSVAGPCENNLSDIESSRIERFFSHVKRPLVIVGGLLPQTRGATLEFLLSLKAPVYLEAPSGIREDPRLAHLKLRSGSDGLSAKEFERSFDGVLRMGSVPTFRLWRDLDLSLQHVPVLSVHDLPFSGLAREKTPAINFASFFSFQSRETITRQHADDVSRENALQDDEKGMNRLENLISNFKHSEVAMVRRLSELIPSTALVFLGNSLPIREWDLAASYEVAHPEIFANRGANGIDGLISTFLGVATTAKKESWLILGDLSALYDLNALAIASPDEKLRIVVINNYGGQIFSRLFRSDKFLNSHRFAFSHWAEMFGFEYLRCANVFAERVFSNLGQRTIIELLSDETESAEFWRQWSRSATQG